MLEVLLNDNDKQLKIIKGLFHNSHVPEDYVTVTDWSVIKTVVTAKFYLDRANYKNSYWKYNVLILSVTPKVYLSI